MTIEIRKNQGKIRPSVIDWTFIEQILEHMKKSEPKYPDVDGKPNYWRNFDNLIEQALNSLTRHTIALNKGEIYDQESGTPHHICIATNCMIINKHFEKFVQDVENYYQSKEKAYHEKT